MARSTRRMYYNKNPSNPGNLEVITKAMDLLQYTITVTNNDKVIPKKFRFTIGADAYASAKSIYDSLVHANSIYPKNQEDLNRRLQFHQFAIEAADSLLVCVETCCKMFKMRSPGYWVSSVVEVKKLARAWGNSSYEQFKDLPSKHNE